MTHQQINTIVATPNAEQRGEPPPSTSFAHGLDPKCENPPAKGLAGEFCAWSLGRAAARMHGGRENGGGF